LLTRGGSAAPRRQSFGGLISLGTFAPELAGPFEVIKMADNPPAQSLFGSIYNLGGSIASYATGSLNAFMGWEEMDVVDPDGESATKGAKKVDEGLNGNVSGTSIYLRPRFQMTHDDLL